MGAYICAICDCMYDSNEVICSEHGNNELICEGCKEMIDYETDQT